MMYNWLCSEAAAAGEDAVMDDDEAAAPSKREVWTAWAPPSNEAHI